MLAWIKIVDILGLLVMYIWIEIIHFLRSCCTFHISFILILFAELLCSVDISADYKNISGKNLDLKPWEIRLQNPLQTEQYVSGIKK